MLISGEQETFYATQQETLRMLEVKFRMISGNLNPFRGVCLPSGLGGNLATEELHHKYLWETELRQMTFKQFPEELLPEMFPVLKDAYFGYWGAGQSMKIFIYIVNN